MIAKQNSGLIFTARFLALLMAIVSIIFYGELHDSLWKLLLWFPITMGYFIWFSNILENYVELKILKAKIRQEVKK